MGNGSKYQAVVIGVSAGGWDALRVILAGISSDFPLPIMIVQHRSGDDDQSCLAELMNNHSALPVKDAEDKEQALASSVYLAPADYHLLIETDCTFSLSADDKVSCSRPSIDVLFESAAEIYGPALIGVILTGANNDGANGIKTVKEWGGLTIVQNPSTAHCPIMPESAIKVCNVDYTLDIEEIPRLLTVMLQSELDIS